MNNIELKKEIMPNGARLLMRAMENNPYMSSVTESGLELISGEFDNPDTGERDMNDFPTQCAEVIEVGPKCEYVKPGDHVIITLGSLTPVPFKGEILWSTNECNLIAIMADDLSERFNR